MRTRPVLTALAAILLHLAGEAAAQAGPSFDCDDASTSTEAAICGSDRLSRLEMSMFRAFEGLAERIGAQEARAIADELLLERQACRGDEACIEVMLTVSAGVFGTVGTTTSTSSLAGAIRAERARREAELQVEDDVARVVRPVPRPEALVEEHQAVREAAAQSPMAPRSDVPSAGSAQQGPGSVAAERTERAVAMPPRSPLGRVFSVLSPDERLQVERNLADAGLLIGGVDGVWDEATERALTQVERDGGGNGSLPEESDPMSAFILLDFVGSDAFREAHKAEEAPTEFLPVVRAAGSWSTQ